MSTTQTDHSTEIAHDTKLYELLTQLQDARAAHASARAAVIRSVAGPYVSHTYVAHVADDRPGAIPHTMRYMPLADLPIGTIYWQSKTWTKGEGDRARTIDSISESGSVTSHPTTLAEALAAAAADSPLVAKLDEAGTAVDTLQAAITEHELNYTGWSRFFLVTSSSGHVHNGMNCSTCNNGLYATQYAPIVSLSAHTETEAVEVLGETLCSVCFPEAPVNGKPSKISAAKARKLAEAGR